jgi:hypothetical protein
LLDTGDSNRELIGVSPSLIAEIMGIITLIVPFAIIPTSAPSIFGIIYSQPFIYGLFWVYTPISIIQYSIYTFDLTWLTVPLSTLNLVYLVQVVRYYQGKISRSEAIWTGIFSLVFPTILFLLAAEILNPFGIFGLIIPVPIQFIAGLTLMYRVPGPVASSETTIEMQAPVTSVSERVQVLSELFSDSEDTGSSDTENNAQ